MNDDLDRLMDKVLGPETAEICRQELPWLRGPIRRFRAVVVDAGGGEVRLLVDRDTDYYPEIGSTVEVLHNDGQVPGEGAARPRKRVSPSGSSSGEHNDGPEVGR